MSRCVNGFNMTVMKVVVTSGKQFHASHTDFFPLPSSEKAGVYHSQ